METRLKLVEDKLAIKELVDRFSNLADLKDVQAQTLLFTEEAKVDTWVGGKLVSSVSGRSAIGKAFGDFLDRFRTVYHLNGQLTLEVDGERATGTSYCQVTLIGEEERRSVMTAIGVRYRDSYVCRAGEWLIDGRVSDFCWRERREFTA